MSVTPRKRALTLKQEAFASARAEGQTYAQAYQAVYGTAGRMSDATANVKGFELSHTPPVAARIKELHEARCKALEAEALWTRRDSTITLAEIARDSAAPQASRVAAVKELNVMHGFNAPVRIEAVVAEVSPAELLSRMDADTLDGLMRVLDNEALPGDES